MDSIQFLLHGFSIAFQPMNLFYCFVGVLAGTLVGVMPALGPPAAVALLLPSVYSLDPVNAIIMLAGINYGAMYGGSTTSILVNVPGEAASVVTCLDGYEMAKKGRAGPALGISAFGSFIAGNLSLIGLVFFAPALARAALRLGSPEYFMLFVLSLTMVSYMVRGSMVKALMMVAWGLILSSVGMDLFTGKLRFTYGSLFLQDGIHIVALVIGLFGLREVLFGFEKPSVEGELLTTKIKGLFPTLQDWKISIKPILRGSGVGFFSGLLPGIGSVVPTFISYGLERKLSKHPEDFGKGAIEGVAGPEACNNGHQCGAQIPLYSLGIPTGPLSSMMLAALMIWGLHPGPQFIQRSPDVFWGLVASMYLGNVMLLFLNLPLIPLWVMVLRIPFVLLNILILIFCIIGSYSVFNEMGDVYLVFVLGLVGFLAKKFGYEPAPMILGFILGPLMETTLRQSLILSRGSFADILMRPISATLLVVVFMIVISAIVWGRKTGREDAEKDEKAKEERSSRWDRITGLFGLFFAIFIIIQTVPLGIGGIHEPGAGFFPCFAGTVLAVLSTALVVRAQVTLRTKKVVIREDRSKRRWTVVYIYIAFIVYALIFERLGFIPSTFLLIIFLFKMLERKKWWSALVTAALVVLSAHAVFNYLLNCELPNGILDVFF